MMFNWEQYVNDIYEDSSVATDVNFPLQVELERNSTVVAAEPEIMKAVENKDNHSIVIWGRPGSGKSFLLDTITLRIAEDLLTEIDNFNTYSDDDTISFYPTPSSIIPVLIRLRLFDVDTVWSEDGHLKIETVLQKKLEAYGMSEDLATFFRSGPRFVLLIDDLDEVVRRNFMRNIQEVRNFVDKYAFVKLIIAGRKVATRVLDHSRYRTYKLLDLLPETVQFFLENSCKPPKEYLYEQVTFDESLASFLATPWFAVNAVEYWNQPSTSSATFRLGDLLYRLLDRIIYRQIQTEDSEDVEVVLRNRVWNLQELAFTLMCSGRKNLTRDEIRNMEDTDLQWFQHMEFLTQSETSPQFVNSWIQATFAVGHVKDEITDAEQRISFLREKIVTLNEVTAAFIKILSDVTGADYLFLLQTDARIQQYSELTKRLLALEFERSVFDYFNGPFQCKETYHGVRDKRYLGDREIDVYAKKTRNEYGHEDIYVVECKYRLPPYTTSIRTSEIEQLLAIWEKVNGEEQRIRERRSQTVTVFPILFISGRQDQRPILENIRDNNFQLWEQVRQSKMKIWQVDLPVENFLKGKFKIMSDKIVEIL